MAANPATTLARNEFFQQLKACCVPASQLAIKPPSDHATSKDLLRRLGQLFDVLSGQMQRDATVMDEKLADYVFFPLSHVFRQQERQPAQVLEMALRCLTVLIVHGWKSKLSAELVKQLLVLLTFIIAGVPNKAQQTERPEETSLEAYRSLTALFQAAGSSALCASGLVEEDTVPALGHCVSVILDGAVDGPTADIQTQALKALQALFVAVRDDSALASFLPGTVSALVKVLSAPSGKKRRVLVNSLQALRTVLVRVLGDLRTRSLAAKKASQEDDGEKGKVLTPAWLSATASQIKLALSSVLKLRMYDDEEVREALERLCIGLLDECHTSLANCQSIVVETAMMLAPEPRETTLVETSLHDLVALYPELEEAVKNSVFNWISSLPRRMQSTDEKIKLQAIRNVLKGTEMVANLQIDSSILQDSIATTLRDSVTSLSVGEKPSRVTVEPTLWLSMDMVNTLAPTPEFRPVLMSQESQVTTRKALKELLSRIGPTSQQIKLARDMLDSAQNSIGPSQVAAYWLALELAKAVIDRSNPVDDFLDLSTLSAEDESHEQILDDLYEFSVTLLDSHTEISDVDWRLEALALEATALVAGRSGQQFRPELIDVLYPIATFLGSPVPELREHAIVTLNSLAASCGYANVSALIVDNADYMVNSISLRLNTFDFSPTSSRVLTMLVRLTGPRLIPFMDDVIASIFAALDNYHGYPVLVDSLFSVLKEVVEQGVKSNRLLLEGRASGVVDHKKRRQKAPTVEELLDQAEERQRRRKIWEEEEAALEPEEGQGHPKKPWGPGKDKGKGAEGDDSEEGNGRIEEEEKPPKTPTYVMLEKIAYLTQHYLTSPTPALRKSLLDLLAKVSPALAADEDAYLPLVHAVWPVVVARLYDTEPFVVIAACDALCGICSAAGDFVSSRIRTEWWSGLGSWCRGAKREAAKHASRRLLAAQKGSSGVRRDGTISGVDILIPVRSGSGMERSLRMGDSLATSGASGGGGLGRFAQSAQVWDGVVRLLTSIVSYVHVEDKIFGEILDLLADLLPHNAEMREALEVVDEDAVRRVMQERGGQAEGIPAMTVDSNPPRPDG